MKDDSKETFEDAVGLASYSDNRSRTQSYGFIFDSIRMQAELNRQLKLRTNELEKLNEILNQFVNVEVSRRSQHIFSEKGLTTQ